MVFNEKKCVELVTKQATPTILRVFFFIAFNQHPQTGFFRSSKTFLAKKLKIDPKSLYLALKWLEKNYIVHQQRCGDYFEFMVSPYYVEWGDDNQARIELWNKLWADHWKQRNRKN